MDYEKKYKEALERARQFSEKPYLEDSAWIVKYIFPELKESEDERIELLNYLYDVHDDDEERARWIAWLEKQGEKMSDVRYSILDKLIEADDIYQASVNDAMVEEARHRAVEALSKLEISKLLGLEKYSKQKSVEWSEEDEKQARQIERIVHDDGCTQKLQKQIADWFKSLKDRYAWRPSMAQLNALSIVSKGNAPDDIEAIVSLYNNLKKLMEE